MHEPNANLNGQQWQQVQCALIIFGCNAGNTLVPDGDKGPKTSEGLGELQTRYGLEVTGDLNRATLELMYDRCSPLFRSEPGDRSDFFDRVFGAVA